MNEVQTKMGKSSVFFTKQPIFGAQRCLWGYELLGGEMRGDLVEIFPRQESAAGLSSSTYLGLQEAMERGKKIMVAFDEAGILSGMPHALPSASGVVRLLAGKEGDSGLESALQALRDDGYQIALDIPTDHPLPEVLLNRADMLIFDLGTVNSFSLL